MVKLNRLQQARNRPGNGLAPPWGGPATGKPISPRLGAWVKGAGPSRLHTRRWRRAGLGMHCSQPDSAGHRSVSCQEGGRCSGAAGGRRGTAAAVNAAFGVSMRFALGPVAAADQTSSTPRSRPARRCHRRVKQPSCRSGWAAIWARRIWRRCRNRRQPIGESAGATASGEMNGEDGASNREWPAAISSLARPQLGRLPEVQDQLTKPFGRKRWAAQQP